MMNDIVITTEDVKRMICKMSNNSVLGLDGIPVCCLKNGGSFISDAIADIARSSIDEQKVPEVLKKAWITPVWKGGDRKDPNE